MFKIKVSMGDTNLRAINRIKRIIGAGKIDRGGEDKASWGVADRKKIKEYIYPLLDAYPLRGVKYYEYQKFKEGMQIAEDKKLTVGEKREKLRALKEKSKEVKEVTHTVSNNPEDWGRKAEDVIKDIEAEKLREIYDP